MQTSSLAVGTASSDQLAGFVHEPLTALSHESVQLPGPAKALAGTIAKIAPQSSTASAASGWM
jgi:hypothetical protein